MKIHIAKPRQHSDVRNEVRQGKWISKINTPSVLLGNLVAIWIKHGGSLIVIVLFGAVIGSLVY